MDANHRPVVRGADKAIWSRLKLIPFTVTIPDDEIDADLPDKLKAEASGVLAWAVRGRLGWQKEGFCEPEEVQKSVENWKSEDDPFKEFFEDECEFDTNLFCKGFPFRGNTPCQDWRLGSLRFSPSFTRRSRTLMRVLQGRRFREPHPCSRRSSKAGKLSTESGLLWRYWYRPCRSSFQCAWWLADCKERRWRFPLDGLPAKRVAEKGTSRTACLSADFLVPGHSPLAPVDPLRPGRTQHVYSVCVNREQPSSARRIPALRSATRRIQVDRIGVIAAQEPHEPTLPPETSDRESPH